MTDAGETPDELADAIAALVGRLTDGAWDIRADHTEGKPDLSIVVGERHFSLRAGPTSDASEANASAIVAAVTPLLGVIGDLQHRLHTAEQEAITDHLTGLLNRWGWDRAMRQEDSRCARHDHYAVVAVVDLDDLKRINDMDGHLGGDLLITMAADALRRSCRAEDVLARIGGDEFGLIAVEDKPHDVEIVGDRVRRTLAEAGVEASVGVAGRRSEGGLRTAYRLADRAMYREKARRKTDRRAGSGTDGR